MGTAFRMPKVEGLPERMREASARLGLYSVSDIARHVGVTRPQMDKYLDGTSQPSLVLLLHIAERLGVSVCWLLGKACHA